MLTSFGRFEQNNNEAHLQVMVNACVKYQINPTTGLWDMADILLGQAFVTDRRTSSWLYPVQGFTLAGAQGHMLKKQGLTLTYFYTRAVREWLQIYTRATRIYTRAVRFANRFHYKTRLFQNIFPTMD